MREMILPDGYTDTGRDGVRLDAGCRHIFGVVTGQKREARLRARCPGDRRLALISGKRKDVDGRVKPGHDE